MCSKSRCSTRISKLSLKRDKALDIDSRCSFMKEFSLDYHVLLSYLESVSAFIQ